MSESDAHLRVGAYCLLADLVEWGPTERLHEGASASPILGPALAQAESDELAATHTAAVTMQVFPFAGVFLHRSAQAGSVAGELVETYSKFGFQPSASGPEVDHLATLLRALAHLSAAEAGDSGIQVQRAKDAARGLLDDHLLRWLPAWSSAMGRLEAMWPRALGTQVLELVLHHRESLGECTSTHWSLDPLPDLDATETDLRAIARALATPSVAGIHLSRHDISLLARGARAPTGFGHRALLLENALQSAARYGTLDTLAGHAQALFDSWVAELESIRESASPGVRHATEPWLRRAGEMRRVLARIGAAAPNAA